jgi:NADPH:quinone reductase-like Zn-dependent oxidoreductase
MKAFELRGFGMDQLVPTERDIPSPGPGEVLVRLRAVSLNYRDLLVIQGKYNPRMALPRVPVSDGAGEIAALGEGVTAWQVGDRVVLPFMPGWWDGPLSAEATRSALGGDVDGLLREYAVFPGVVLLPLPAHLSFEQAATLPCAAVTAWNGLFRAGNLQSGQTVLLQGTGGVSLFGLQFAKMAGASVILISSSDEKLERARALGADHLINYATHPDWDSRVLELTGRRGVDLTLEVGGAGTLNRTFRASAYGATVSLIGVLAGIAGDVHLGHVLHKALRVHGVYVGSREMFAEMNRAIESHRLEPVIDQVFPFDEVKAALQHLAFGRHMGKVVVRV